MKLVLATIVFLLLTYNVKAQGINFIEYKSWNYIKEKAKKDNKYIFIDAYATWCVPCKQMDREVYSNATVGNYFNKNFISIKLQIDRTTNDDESIKLRYLDASDIIKTYNIEVVPTFLFFNPNGEIIARGIGYKSVEEIIALGKSSEDTSNHYLAQFKNYEKGKLNFSKYPMLAKKAKSLGEKDVAIRIANDYIENYLLTLPEELVYTAENLNFIGDFIGNTRSTAFNFYFKNRNKINSVLGPNKSEYKIKTTIASEFFPFEGRSFKQSAQWDSITVALRNKFGELGAEVVNGNRMISNFYAKDWKYFGIFYEKYMETAFRRPDYTVNDLSYEVFKEVEDRDVLNFACDVVMKYAIEEWYQNEPAAYDTYAQLLYKCDRIDEAITWQERAVKLKKGAPDSKLYTENLEKMKLKIPTWIINEKK